MNKTVIKLLSVLGIIGAIFGLIFSFLPISKLAIIPAAFGLVVGSIAFYSAKKQNIGFKFAKIVVLMALFAIVISVGKELFTNNEIKEEVQKELQEKDKKSEEEAIKDIEELEELDDLEDL